MGKTAVNCGKAGMVYTDLNSRANQLAHVLIKEGVGGEDLVGMVLLRSINLPIVLLSILKTGAA